MKKYLIAPDFEDPHREFKNFTSYFDKKNDLIKLLNYKKHMKINFSKFEAKGNLVRVIQELEL